MPNSWEAPLAWDRDRKGLDAVRELLHIQLPMLAPAMLDLSELSVRTALVDGISASFQIVAGCFRENR